MAMMPPMAVVETQSFLASAARLGIGETERTALIIYLAVNPEVGVVVPDTGGVRKLRWALPGRGKSGGARVIYYYHNESIPLYALGHLRQEPEGEPIRRREKGGAQNDCRDQSRTRQEEIAPMPTQSKPKAKKHAPIRAPAGRRLLASLNQALAYARGEHVPGIRVTYVQ